MKVQLVRYPQLDNRRSTVGTRLLLIPAICLSPLFSPLPASCQEVIQPDLGGIASGEGWTVVNRTPAVETVDGVTQVSFDAQAGDGAAWLDGIDFKNGTIEVSIRGKNNPGRSFVGIAFRGVDDQTYDAVYFRPFNFLADNALSLSHMVQYVSHPENTWSRLREEHTGVYENGFLDPPDPDGFFRARIVIEKPVVRVYVGEASEPCLVVNELTERTGGRIGLWMGNGSDGDFADLVIKPGGTP